MVNKNNSFENISITLNFYTQILWGCWSASSGTLSLVYWVGCWVNVYGPFVTVVLSFGVMIDGRERVIGFEALGTGCQRETRKCLSTFSRFWSDFLVLIINNSAAIKLTLRFPIPNPTYKYSNPKMLSPIVLFL